MTTISAQTRLALAHRHQAGLSLVELMISIVIGLLLLAGISSLIAAQGSAGRAGRAGIAPENWPK